MLRWLLEHGADPNVMAERPPGAALSIHRWTPLANAAELTDPTALQILLSYGAELDPQALFHAIGAYPRQRNGIATMAVLIDHGADVNYVAEKWATPLHLAVRRNSKEKVRYLLERGADPTLRYKEGGTTASEYALQCGRTELHEILEVGRIDHAP